MVRRVPVVPAAFEPFTRQPLMVTATPALLRSSMNSSLPPDGPRVRNSEMTMSDEAADAAAAGARSAPAASAVTRRLRLGMAAQCSRTPGTCVSELLHFAE